MAEITQNILNNIKNSVHIVYQFLMVETNIVSETSVSYHIRLN
jgi:hypothetical protein